MENDRTKRRKRGPRRTPTDDKVSREAAPTASDGVIVPPMQEQPDHPLSLVSSGGAALSGQGNLTVLADVAHATDLFDATVLPKQSKASRAIRNREQVIAYSNIIIFSLQEALDYDPARHHNRPPPELRLEDARYLQDIRDLIAELKRLNALLEAGRPQRRGETKRTVIDVNKHINRFLENYIPLFAKGTACLTVAAMASLLSHVGVGEDIIKNILAMAPLGRR